MPSTITTILAACGGLAGPTGLGELPESVLQLWALPERVTMVQADNRIMFHWAERKGPGGLRSDTATYHWVDKSCRDVVTHPYAIVPGKKRDKRRIVIIERSNRPIPILIIHRLNIYALC